MNRDVFILNEAESYCLICCWKGCLAIEWLWEWWWICWEYRVTVRTGQLEVKQLDRNHHHHHRRIRGSYNYCSHQYGLVILQALLGPSCQYRSPLLAFIFPPNPHALLLLAVGWKFWWKFPLWRDQQPAWDCWASPEHITGCPVSHSTLTTNWPILTAPVRTF